MSIELGDEVIIVGNVISVVFNDSEDDDELGYKAEVQVDNGDVVVIDTTDLDTSSEGRFYTTVDNFLSFRKELIKDEILADKENINKKEEELAMLEVLTENHP